MIHLSGLGDNSRGDVFFHSALAMTGFTGASQPTFTVQNGSLIASGNEIRATNINGQTLCSAGAGCGSVKMNGLVSSVTFQVDLIVGGSRRMARGSSDIFNRTISIDEDYGDAPASYDQGSATSNLVGGVFIGSGVTPDAINITNDGTLAASPIASANADADSDDGVIMPATVLLDQTVVLDIPIETSGSTAFLYAWPIGTGMGFSIIRRRISSSGLGTAVRATLMALLTTIFALSLMCLQRRRLVRPLRGFGLKNPPVNRVCPRE